MFQRAMTDPTKKRRKGEGSVVRPADSPCYLLKFGYRGRTYRKQTDLTDEYQAYQALETFKVEVRNEIVSPPSKGGRVTVDDLFDDLVRDWKRRGLLPVRYYAGGREKPSDYEQRYARNLRPFFGRMRAEDVTNAHVERYIDKRFREGAEGATIQREFSMLRRSYKLALRGKPPKVRGAIPYFPTFEDKKREGFLEIEYHDGFAAACLAVRRGGLWLEGVFEVAYTYGWRKAEVVNLAVGQVRFENPSEGYIHLPGDQSKNRQARLVPFSSAWCPRLVEILQAAVAGKASHERVFTRGKQQDMPVKRFDKLWRTVAGMAGVSEELLVHDLRRTACRNMLSAGFTETKIMEICGWKSRSMFQRYALTNPADLKREIPKLGEYWQHARAGREAVATVAARRGETCRSEQGRASVRNNGSGIGQDSRKPAARVHRSEFAVVHASGRRKTELAGVRNGGQGRS